MPELEFGNQINIYIPIYRICQTCFSTVNVSCSLIQIKVQIRNISPIFVAFILSSHIVVNREGLGRKGFLAKKLKAYKLTRR